MSQQGGRPTGPGPEDDWWGQLYDDASDDTGPAPAPDSLDDRFASASGTLRPDAPPDGTRPPVAPPPRDVPGTPAVPAPRPTPARMPEDTPPSAPTTPPRTPAAPPHTTVTPPRAPWEPPPSAPTPPSPGPAPTPPDHAPTLPALPNEPPSAASAPSGPTAAPAYGSWTPAAPAPSDPSADESPGGTGAGESRLEPLPPPPPSRAYVGSRPPTYDPEPTALPAADPDALDALVPDTVLDGARYGACTLRAASVRGDSARYRGEPRRDALLTARFGTGERALVLVALATGVRTAPGAHRAAADACRWIGAAVGRSHERLADDIRAARRGDLKSGLHRLTDRSLGRLRADAAEQGLAPDDYAATLRCLLLSADPECRTRVFFGVGPGGLFRLRDGEWQDIEPEVAEIKGDPVLGFGSPPHETPDGDRLTMDLNIPTPPSPYEPAPVPPREPFRFRTSVARPGDVLLMCGTGFAEPLRGEPGLRDHLADRWSDPEPPGLTAYLADTQVRVKGYADDRTAVAVWEA
ncbi:protein phosphatase 2C domain-containing protein [Streptomyces sp. NPDC093594]|uniref:protein phosphatase 2C domain-containing protein n=1 Tax=Streptomyces sp. NPDC093594 TaxID=3155305 RepID=UPI003450EC2A